jgi:hypothetical protein
MLPEAPMQPNKPWIRHQTMAFIKLREAARATGDYEEETSAQASSAFSSFRSPRMG